MIRVDRGFGEDARAVDWKDTAAHFDARKGDAQVTRIVGARGGLGVKYPAHDVRAAGDESLVVDDDGVVERTIEAISGASRGTGNRLRKANRQRGAFGDASWRDERLRRGGPVGRLTVERQLLGGVGIGNTRWATAGAKRKLQEQ